jgi:hypothetical protein
MVDSQSKWQETRRTDDQLFAMLDEAALWTINGPTGEVLEMAPCLRDAIAKAQDLRNADQHVSAIVRRPDDMVIAFRGQVDRVRALIDATGGN